MRYRFQNSKNRFHKSLKVGSAGLCLLLPLLANNAKAQSVYFDVNGATTGSGVVTGSTYSWEDPDWSTSSAGTVATSTFVEGDFARFAAGTDATGSYTVTADANHTLTGMYLVSGTANTVTINGTGVLSLASGLQGFLVNGSGQSLVVDSVIGGTGGLENELSGSLFLYGNNTYSGGTTLGTSAGLNFNNNNSFGIGPITWGATTTVLATPAATAPITIANGVVTEAGTQIFVGVAAAPVTFSGPWTLPATGTSTFQNQPAGTTVTISGAISGAAGFKKAGAGTLVLSGANTFTGPLTVSAGIAQAGAGNVLPTITSLILSGGTFTAGGFNQAMPSTTLSLTSSSTLNFGSGTVAMSFANSSLLAWSGTLNLADYNSALDTLQVGTDGTGLTTAQLADITFDGGPAGTAQISSQGYVTTTAVPEPSTIALGLLGGLGLFWRVRRQTA